MNTKSITEGALIAVIALILSLISYYIPLFSGFTYFLLPIPIIVMYVRHGTIPALFSSIAASLLLLFFMDPINALLLASLIIFPGMALGYSYYKDKTGGIRVIYGYFGFFIAIAIEIIAFQYLSGVPFIDEFINELNTISETVKQTYSAAGLFEGNQGTELLENLDEVMATVKQLLPAMMLTIPLVFSYCTVLVTDFFFKRLKIKYIPVKKITEWEFPTYAKNSLAIVTLITIILNFALQNSNYEIYIFTIEVMIDGIYVLMGISFVFWFLQYKTKKNLIVVKVLILILCFTFSFMISILMIVGVFDVFFNIRRFIRLRNNDES